MNYDDVLVKCPFYSDKQDVRHGIRCESLFKAKDATDLHMFRGDKTKAIKTYCANKYQNCPYYEPLMNKYEKG